MIVLNLCCDHEHLFEGWFGSAAAFETQRERGQVVCPVCGSASISRRPSAPYLNTGSVPPAAPVPRSSPRPATPQQMDAVATAVAMLRRFGKESEDVGERFVEEARRIHYGESEARNIKGKASHDDIGELIDEGIMVLPVPPDDEALH